ncbi:MAG: hypothetical protein P8H56_12855 [Crocinitomicaceae bacterium]|nr:hypothetical protein [Crocinitomicaceae bacterium]MDG1659461.1 hypothetical protein [Crocinitomicaceae bacterium]
MEHQFQHTKTFRYQEIARPSDVEKVLYVLHGYGQLVEFFIRKFRSTPEDLLIVAPEGMHRFYINGSSGRVGASWMTKESRDSDIEDTISFLNQVDEEISQRYNIRKRYLLGFSQGGAAAARWEQLGTVKFDGIALWACIFPPDLHFKTTSNNNVNHYFAIGDNDEFYEENSQKKLMEYYRELGYQIVPYRGTHDIVNETLTVILRQMDSNS